MKVLNLSRLTQEESEQHRKDDPTREALPEWVSLSQLTGLIGKSDRTLKRYRAIAFEEIGLYWQICLKVNPGYLSGLASQPDKPPFTKLQAGILIEVSDLFDREKNELVVRALLNQKYLKPENLG